MVPAHGWRVVLRTVRDASQFSQLNLLANIVPLRPSTLCGTNIRIVANSNGRLTLSFLGSLGPAVERESGVKAMSALNIVYGEEKRSIVQLIVFSMLLTICSTPLC